MLLLLREGPAVELGDFGPGWVECRFQSAKYAEDFATMNHALELNRETIQEELEHAIKSIQGMHPVQCWTGPVKLGQARPF